MRGQEFAQNFQTDRKIVGCEDPDRVHIVMRIVPPDSTGLESDDRAKFLRPGDAAELRNARMVPPLVHDEEKILGVRQRGGSGGTVGQRLLDEDGDLAFEQRAYDLGVRCGWRSNDNTVHVREFLHG